MASSRKIAGLIVAGGYSSRMGTFKPLLPLGNKTVLETAIASLRQGGIEDIRVVTGHRAEDLNSLIQALGCKVVENKRYADGMFSSIAAGVRTLVGEADAFLLLPGDNPLIRKSSIKELVRAYRKSHTAVVYPAFNGQRGHPPLISSLLFPSILKGKVAGGLRTILERFECQAIELELADQGVLLDMDTAPDYEKLIAYSLRRSIPTYEECLALLHAKKVDERIIRHGQAVAVVAKRLAGLLNKVGLTLNLDLVVAASLVHDVAKGSTNHSQRGGRLLACKGFSALTPIVATHMELDFDGDHIDEAAVVFLADKLVQGDRYISLIERFTPALERFADKPDILRLVESRLKTAEAIRGKILILIGKSPTDELVLQ